METITLSDYQSLAELRYQIRRFLYFSEQAARKARMEPRQHQLLAALKGLPENMRPPASVRWPSGSAAPDPAAQCRGAC